MAIARISFSVKSLNFFSIVLCPQTSVTKKNRTNRAAKSSSAPNSTGMSFCQPRPPGQVVFLCSESRKKSFGYAVIQAQSRDAPLSGCEGSPFADFVLHSIEMVLRRLLRQAEAI